MNSKKIKGLMIKRTPISLSHDKVGLFLFGIHFTCERVNVFIEMARKLKHVLMLYIFSDISINMFNLTNFISSRESWFLLLTFPFLKKKQSKFYLRTKIGVENFF